MDNIEKALRDRGYKTNIVSGNLTLKRRGSSSLILICTLLAIPVFWISTFAHFTVFLLGIILLLAPWIFRRWQFPPEVQFLRNEGIQLGGGLFGGKRLLPFSDITELQLERVVKPTDASPFHEGTDEFVYNFMAATGGHRHKLLRLVYRPDDPEEVESIRGFLLQYLQKLKSKG